MAVDASGAPFNGSWIVGTGNIAADMYANIMAESSGRLLATRLWKYTDDPGMKDMLSFLIARDTCIRISGWLCLKNWVVLKKIFLFLNSFPQGKEKAEFNYNFISTNVNKNSKAKGRWSEGKSIDGKGEFTFSYAEPHGPRPDTGAPDAAGFAQTDQMTITEKVVNKENAGVANRL